MTTLAPIALFVYSRLWHTRQTIEALQKNELAIESDLIIFSDQAKSEADIHAVEAVRLYIHQVKGFKSVTVVERDENFGLARSIIDGVTDVCDRYGSVIVLEDDIVTSSHFLGFMNAALEKFSNESKVWHVSGWNYPIDPDGLGDAFFWRAMNCWGWATWADRWAHYEKNPQHLVNTWSKEKIKRFNLELDNGCDFWHQVTANLSGKMNTWAVFWYATIFEHGGLCLNPTISFVFNIGNDGSGENCEDRDLSQSRHLAQSIPELPNECKESESAVQRVRVLHEKRQETLLRRLAKRVKKILIRKTGI